MGRSQSAGSGWTVWTGGRWGSALHQDGRHAQRPMDGTSVASRVLRRAPLKCRARITRSGQALRSSAGCGVAPALRGRGGLRRRRGATPLRRGYIDLDRRGLRRRDRPLEPDNACVERLDVRAGRVERLEVGAVRTLARVARVRRRCRDGLAVGQLDVLGVVSTEPVARPVRSRGQRAAHKDDRQQRRREQGPERDHAPNVRRGEAGCSEYVVAPLPALRDTPVPAPHPRLVSTRPLPLFAVIVIAGRAPSPRRRLNLPRQFRRRPNCCSTIGGRAGRPSTMPFTPRRTGRSVATSGRRRPPHSLRPDRKSRRPVGPTGAGRGRARAHVRELERVGPAPPSVSNSLATPRRAAGR